MALYRYVKAPPAAAPPPPARPSPFKHLVGPLFIFLGIILVGSIAGPLLIYQLLITPNLQRPEFVSPVPTNQLGSASTPSTSSPQPDLIDDSQILGTSINYTDAKNWFPDAKFTINQPVDTYYLSIPSLDIADALVTLGGVSLDQSLIQYPGTAKPGQLGTPVIFGHSTLRRFYDPYPQNPQRYISIFSKIMTMKNGDRIYIDYDHIRYTYEVKDKLEVQPDDLYILEQSYHTKELKLITCTPEGTYLRRGVILARLVDRNPVDGPTVY